MQHEEFDFISQIDAGNLYELLILKKEYGIIILHLYKLYLDDNNEKFTEKDIKRTILNIRQYTQREQHEYIKDIIRDLKEFFLKKVSNDGYKLTEYAKGFCESIIKKLKSDFEPSIIEKTLLHFKNSLSDEISFDEWFKFFFAKENTSEIESQLESLERQVINAIKTFRKKISNENLDGLELVKNILDSIEVINIQVQKLKGSLRHIDEIKRKINLIDLTLSPNPQQSLQDKLEAFAFLDSIISDFDRVSNRINQIPPKLRQFYGNMTKIDFERNTNKLLNFLLQKSKITGHKPNWKLEFPKISNVEFEKKIIQSQQKIIFVDNVKEIGDFKKKRQKVYQPKSNKKDRKKQKKAARKKIEKISEVRKIISIIEKDLNLKKVIFLEDYTGTLLKLDENFNVVAKVIFLLIKKFSQKKDYKLTISSTKNKTAEKIIIWNMKIEKL